MKARIRMDYLKALSMCVARSADQRHTLQGVYFEPHPRGGVLAVASNEVLLLAIHDAGGECDEPQIRKVPTGMLFFSASKYKRCSAQFEADSVSVTAGGMTIHGKSQLISLSYPDWRKVLPKRGGDMPTCFALNPEYFDLPRRIAKVLWDVGGHPALITRCVDGDYKVSFQFKGEPVYLIVMQMRLDDPKTAGLPPAWLTVKAGKPADRKKREPRKKA